MVVYSGFAKCGTVSSNRLVPPYPPLENRPSLSAFELILRLLCSADTPFQGHSVTLIISANLKDKIVFQKNQQYALLESRTL